MKKKTIEMYDLQAPREMKHRDGMYWDVVVGKYLSKENMVCAHIVGRAFPSQVVNFVCGPSTADELDTYVNAFCLQKRVQKAMDRGELVIMPLDPYEVPVKRFVLRLALTGVGDAFCYGRQYGNLTTLKELDGRELQFENGLRPILTFLYFRWIHTVAINHMYRQQRLSANFDQLKTKHAWMTVGPWLRKSVLLQMAKLFDCMDDDEIEQVFGNAEDEAEAVRARSLLELIGNVIMAVGEPTQARLSKTQGEAEEEYESESESESESDEDRDMKGMPDLFYDSNAEMGAEYAASLWGPSSDLVEGSDSDEEER
jgi:hypothetical protein